MINTNLIRIKFGELSLKGKNKINFINCLFENIKKALSEYPSLHIKRAYDEFLITNYEEQKDTIINIIKNIPGIACFYEVLFYEDNGLENVCSKVLETFNNSKFKTFKVETKRKDKSYKLNSMEISKRVGGAVLNKIKNVKVDVRNPKLLIEIEVIKDGFYINKKKYQGMGGFPVGINGRVLILISGGIDSPVAAKLILKKGFKADYLTFISPPHTSDRVLDKVKDLIKTITLDGKVCSSKLFVCNFTNIQHEIAHIKDKSYQINIMRRYFFRIAQAIKKLEKYDAIATGESLGQVASQTIDSIKTISSVLDNDTVVLRPLLTYDKIEIVKLAKEYGTYDISILPYEDSCSLFVPANPVTKPNIKVASNLESELFLINDLVEKTINKTIKEHIKI